MIRMHDIASCTSPVDAAASRAIRDGVSERLMDTLRKEPPYSAEIAGLMRRLEDQDWRTSAR